MFELTHRVLVQRERESLRQRAFPGRIASLVERYFFSPRFRLLTQLYRSDLEGGIVERIVAKADGVRFGEDWNDEEPIVFVALGPETVLSLSGQWMWNPLIVTPRFNNFRAGDSTRWPQHFVIERAPRSGMVFHLDSHSSESMESDEIVDCSCIHFLSESRVFHGTLKSLEEVLRAFSWS